MLPPDNIAQRLDSVAEQIEKPDPITAANLRELALVVVGKAPPEPWAFADLHTVFNQDQILQRIGQQGEDNQWVHLMELARNVLILAPLMVTWFAIAQASEGYRLLIDERKDLANQSFLYLWQSGFQGRAFISLGNLAIVDGTLLAIVFVLTAIVYAHSAIGNFRKQGLIKILRENLGPALAGAELQLAHYRRPQPYSAIMNLQTLSLQTLEEIRKERERVTEISRQSQKEREDLTNFTNGLGTELTGFVDRLSAQQSHFREDMKNQLSGFTDGLGTQLAKFNYDQNSHLIAFQNGLGKQLGDLSSHLILFSGDLGKQLSTFTSQLDSVNKGLGKQLDNLILQAGAIHGHVGSELNSFNVGLSKQVEGLVTKLQTVLNKDLCEPLSAFHLTEQQAAEEMTIAAGSIGKARGEIVQVISGLTQSVGQLSQFQTELLLATREAGTQFREAAERTGANAIALEKLLEEQASWGQQLQDGVNVLTVAVNHTAEAASRVGQIADTLGAAQSQLLTAMGDERAAQRELAEYVSRSTESVEPSLQALKQISVNLNGIAIELMPLPRVLESATDVLRRTVADLAKTEH